MSSFGPAFAQNDPQAEKGDGLFKDGSFGSWGIYTGHAAIYYGYYADTWGGQYRHTVIQASGPSYSLDVRPFDYTSASPTFIGSDPSQIIRSQVVAPGIAVVMEHGMEAQIR